ncbi:MAG: biotin--[acetyl-CoA-carboxylase] ligase [Gudongella sp.]|jgi:BirA family biotin operon repressor/biotin-[acetyl-CoA-carboxylase] ligase|nr:biotin--[acetyl-CoA-carboxylase] ligase [Gudongella sp.]
MKQKIIEKLKNADGYLSGQKLSEEFGLSRTAIWKHIKQLKKVGFEIESVTNKGYRLISTPDYISAEKIEESLKNSVIGKNVLYFDSLPSTNNKAKELTMELKEGTVILAEEQTKGKGRLGRSWASPGRKGIYASIVLKPEAKPESVSKLTLLGAAAVSLALDEFAVETKIKWPNDIILNGKKIAGILTEMNSELGIVNYIILGIGINVLQTEEEIPEELRVKATSIYAQIKRPVDRTDLLIAILKNLDTLYSEFKTSEGIDKALDICRDRSAVLGREVIVIQGREERKGQAISINKDGELMVKFESGIENIMSGEVSIRSEHGYI